MQAFFKCPSCEAINPSQEVPVGESVSCRACRWRSERVFGPRGDTLEKCLACGSRDLFVRKNFPQRLGLAIVVGGFGVSILTWSQYWIGATFAVLFATALMDLGLYFLVGDLLECYGCGAQYRAVQPAESQGLFDLEVAERYRQQHARLKSLSEGK